MNNPIGVLDSGIGGLTVCKEIIRELPSESLVYIGDSQNAPYGAKSEREIYQLSKRLISFLLKWQTKLVVIACNTITVSCLEKLRRDFPDLPIVGTVPVVKTAVEVSRNKRIGILSTTQTAKSAYQKNLLTKFATGCTVFNHGTDDLVPILEAGELTGKRIKERLQKILAVFQKEQIDTLALGCTHYPLLKRKINDILGPQVIFLDSGAAVARQVHRILTNNNDLSKNALPSYHFWTTGKKEVMEKVAKKLEIDTIGTTIDAVVL